MATLRDTDRMCAILLLVVGVIAMITSTSLTIMKAAGDTNNSGAHGAH